MLYQALICKKFISKEIVGFNPHIISLEIKHVKRLYILYYVGDEFWLKLMPYSIPQRSGDVLFVYSFL